MRYFVREQKKKGVQLMKKRVLGVFVALITVLQLMACSPNACKESGCDDEVYEDGYCKYHYYLKAGSDIIKDIVN